MSQWIGVLTVQVWGSEFKTPSVHIKHPIKACDPPWGWGKSRCAESFQPPVSNIAMESFQFRCLLCHGANQCETLCHGDNGDSEKENTPNLLWFLHGPTYWGTAVLA